MLPNILQSTGRPHDKNDPAQNVTGASAEKAALAKGFWHQVRGSSPSALWPQGHSFHPWLLYALVSNMAGS